MFEKESSHPDSLPAPGFRSTSSVGRAGAEDFGVAVAYDMGRGRERGNFERQTPGDVLCALAPGRVISGHGATERME